MENSFQLSISNKEVFEFYEKHGLSFEQVNILFVDILKKLISDLDSSLNSNLATKLLDKFNMLDSKMDTIGMSVSKCQTELTTIFAFKLTEYRREYIDDLKMILSSNNVDCIAPLIKETNSNLLDKTSLMLGELIPKNQEIISKDLDLQLQLFQSSILNETTKLLASSLDKKTIEDFLISINQSMIQSHQTFTTLISSSESRIENRLIETERKMNEIKEISTENNSTQSTLQNNVSEILKKFEKGSSKGNISEHITYNILLNLFPCAQIDHVGNEQKETGDIVLVRNNKPKILIENKDHDSKNVTKQEVDKFIRDCELQDCCGIMMAQHRGISNKQNFELQIHNGNVLLYLHQVNFDEDKIKIAVEIVEHFKMKLDELTTKEDDSIMEKEVLDEINKEFINYVNQKNTMMKLLKDFGDKMNFSINELKMPCLEKYLSSRFAFSTVQGDNMCKYCEKHIPKSLLQHYRYCPAKKEIESKSCAPQIADIQLVEPLVEISPPETNIVAPIPEKSQQKKKSSIKNYKIAL